MARLFKKKKEKETRSINVKRTTEKKHMNIPVHVQL